MKNQPVRGLFAGSFDPYTMGHHAMVCKAARLFDEVYVLVGFNTAKKRTFDVEEMKAAIEETIRADGLDNVFVVAYDKMIADYCRDKGITYHIRGLRNSMDYEYEENIAAINKLINPNLETIYLRTDDAVVSSSMVRELMAFNKDVSSFLSEPVLRLARQKEAENKN